MERLQLKRQHLGTRRIPICLHRNPRKLQKTSQRKRAKKKTNALEKNHAIQNEARRNRRQYQQIVPLVYLRPIGRRIRIRNSLA